MMLINHFLQVDEEGKLMPWQSLEADVSSVSPSKEQNAGFLDSVCVSMLGNCVKGIIGDVTESH